MIARDEGLRDVAFRARTGGNFHVMNEGLPPGAYHWRVGALPRGEGSEAFSGTSRFTVVAAGAVRPGSPRITGTAETDGTKRVTVRFPWTVSDFKGTCLLELSRDRGFLNMLAVRNTGENYADIDNITPGEYYWRVRLFEDERSQIAESGAQPLYVGTRGELVGSSREIVQGKTGTEIAREEAEFNKLREVAAKKQREEQALRLKEEQARTEKEDLARREREEIARKQQEEQALEQKEELARKQQEELARTQQEELARKQQEDLARKRTEEQTRKQQEELARKQQQELARTQQEELARKRQEEVARKQQEDLARKRTEEQTRKQQQDLARKQQQELARKQQEDLARKRTEEQTRKQQQELARKQQRNLPTSTLETILKSVDIMYGKISQAQIARADVVIAPNVGFVGSADFTHRHEAVLEGEKAAIAALPRINGILSRLRQEEGFPNKRATRTSNLTALVHQ